jgi:hypothetical protein
VSSDKADFFPDNVEFVGLIGAWGCYLGVDTVETLFYLIRKTSKKTNRCPGWSGRRSARRNVKGRSDRSHRATPSRSHRRGYAKTAIAGRASGARYSFTQVPCCLAVHVT